MLKSNDTRCSQQCVCVCVCIRMHQQETEDVCSSKHYFTDWGENRNREMRTSVCVYPVVLLCFPVCNHDVNQSIWTLTNVPHWQTDQRYTFLRGTWIHHSDYMLHKESGSRTQTHSYLWFWDLLNWWTLTDLLLWLQNFNIFLQYSE